MPTTHRSILIAGAALVVLALAGCPGADSGPGPGDAGSDSGSGPGADSGTPSTDAGGDAGALADAGTTADSGSTSDGGEDGGVDAGVPSPSLSAANQTLGLTTVVLVGSATSVGPGWVVISDDASGSPGAVLGQLAVGDGAHANLQVGLSRRVADGEVLHAQLAQDLGVVGTYEPGTDAPFTDGSSAPIAGVFTASVPANTPDVRLQMTASGLTAWVATAEPSTFAAIVTAASPSPTLNLTVGWRYRFDGPGSVHPLQFATLAGTPSSDTLLLAQGTTAGSFEADPGVAWTDVGNTVTFTLTAGLAAQLDGYRCGNHFGMGMRGATTD